MATFIRVSLQLLAGFKTTLFIFFLTLLFAIPLGFVVCFGSMSKHKIISKTCQFVIWVIRGTPLMLQLIVVFFGPGLIFGYEGLSRFSAVILAFSINYACYFSEIYRGGLESIDKGQTEAGKALGMNSKQIFIHILLLQLIKRIIAPMSNEIITLVNDTSLARVIAVYEVMWQGQAFIKAEGLIWPMFYTGAYYLLFSGLLTLFFKYLEKKLNYFN